MKIISIRSKEYVQGYSIGLKFRKASFIINSFFDSIHVKQYEIATCIIDLWGCTEISPKGRNGAAHCFNPEKNLNSCVVEYNTFSDIS